MKLIHCMGYETITDPAPEVDVEFVYDLFPDVPYGALDRPVGQVDLLIGQDQVELLPDTAYRHDKLRVLTTSIGSGWVLGGYDNQIKPGLNVSFTNAVNHWRTAHIAHTSHIPELMDLSNGPAMEKLPAQCCSVQCQPMDFMAAEETGVSIPRRCGLKKASGALNLSLAIVIICPSGSS